MGLQAGTDGAAGWLQVDALADAQRGKALHRSEAQPRVPVLQGRRVSRALGGLGLQYQPQPRYGHRSQPAKQPAELPTLEAPRTARGEGLSQLGVQRGGE